MTADGTVVWDKVDLPDLGRCGATMYLSQDGPNGVSETLIRSASKMERPNEEHIGQGSWGVVTKFGIGNVLVAIKRTREYYCDTHMGLSGMRANVALSAGLKRLESISPGATTVTEENKHRAITYALRAVNSFGILIPNAPDWDPLIQAVSIMSYVPGIPAAGSNGMPSKATYKPVFDAACAATGLDPAYVNYDLHTTEGLPRPDNLLITLPQKGRSVVIATKIDSYAAQKLEF